MKHQQEYAGANMSATGQGQLISVARITKTRGLRGEVKAELLTDFPHRFTNMLDLWVQRPEGQLLRVRLENHWFHQDRIILKFAGYDTIDQAAALVGSLVMVSENELVTLPEDTFFQFDLIGCQVRLTDGATLGRVVEVVETGGTPLLMVQHDSDSEYLIPFAKDICPHVDVAAKQIIVDPPEGLLELNQPPATKQM